MLPNYTNAGLTTGASLPYSLVIGHQLYSMVSLSIGGFVVPPGHKI